MGRWEAVCTAAPMPCRSGPRLRSPATSTTAASGWRPSPAAPGGGGGGVGGRLDVVEPQPVPTRSPGERAAASLARFVADRAGEFIALLIVGALLLRFWPELMERARAAA